MADTKEGTFPESPAGVAPDRTVMMSEAKRSRGARSTTRPPLSGHEQPLVEPHVSHLRHVPFRTIVKFWHSEQETPS